MGRKGGGVVEKLLLCNDSEVPLGSARGVPVGLGVAEGGGETLLTLRETEVEAPFPLSAFNLVQVSPKAFVKWSSTAKQRKR